MVKKRRMTVICAIVMVCTGLSYAETLTIYEIQYNPSDPNISAYCDQRVDCSGGIVIHDYNGFKPWVILYDPNYPDGWGAIRVKDFSSSKELFSSVGLGAWVSIQNALVEESSGNTQLNYENTSSFSILSSDHPLPDPIIISANDLPAPVEGPPDEWYVADHRSEQYEAMLVQIQNVTVTDVNLGKGDPKDNYELTDATDPNYSSWAADYMNYDNSNTYHRYIELGKFYCDLTGIVEQYDGGDYDYYQLLTRRTADIRPELEADITGDCAVDFKDIAVIGQYWLRGK